VTVVRYYSHYYNALDVAYGIQTVALFTPGTFVVRTRQHMYVAHDARSHTHKQVRACQHTKYKHACMSCTYTYLHSSTQRNSTVPHYFALMRAGYVLHSLECLECGVVGKCCSNVLRSLIAYGVSRKAVRTCVCEKNDTMHVCSSRCARPYT
jgi:hypothetical protein